MKAIVDGWLCVPYDGHDMATLHMAVTSRDAPTESDWQPAYLGYAYGRTVAKIRASESMDRMRVWLRVNGYAEKVG